MNWLRAQLDRIKGRLVLVFAVAALGMAVIWGVSSYALKRYSDTASATTGMLAERLQLTARLEAATSDQLQTARVFEVTGSAQALDSLAVLDSVAQNLSLQYVDILRDSTGAIAATSANQLGPALDVRRVQRVVGSQVDSAAAASAAGAAADAREYMSNAVAGMNDVREKVHVLNEEELRGIAALAADASGQIDALRQNLLILALVVLLIVAVLAWYTMRAIERPLQRLVTAANRLGEGDLAVVVDDRMPDEFRVLAGAFTGMAAQFRTVVAETVDTANTIGGHASDLSAISEEVAASSGEVSTAMVGVTQGAEEQAFGLRTVRDALDIMRSHVFEIDSASEQVNRTSEQIGDVAEAKRQEVTQALAMLLETRDLVRTSGEEMSDLQKASGSITAFVETIQGIARQTNLLALNAAIEAARAGDHGRGFAVVADEVRKLADGSARAADEVATAVKRISHQIQAVVETIDRGAGKMAGVEEASKSAEAAFEDIVAAVATMRTAAARAAEAAAQNRQAVRTVDAAVNDVGAAAESHAASAEQVSAAAQEQSAATEEMSAASIELLSAADRMRDLVAGFRI